MKRTHPGIQREVVAQASRRHDFASLLLAAGIADRVVMEMMGHSDYSITANRYQHVPDEYLAADRLDAMLSTMSQ